MEGHQEKLKKRYQEARESQICDGKSAYFYLPAYAAYETKYGTKQYYEDIFQKLLGVKQENRDAWYLLALMKTKNELFEAMFEYQDGIRRLYKTEFARLTPCYGEMSLEEKAAYVASGFEACLNKTLLSYKYAPAFEKKYQDLRPCENEAYRLASDAKQRYERKEVML